VSVSDGVLDAFGGTLEALDEVERIARGCSDAASVAEAVAASAALTAPDDVTVLAVRRLPGFRAL
jgi:hypothetical protein